MRLAAEPGYGTELPTLSHPAERYQVGFEAFALALGMIQRRGWSQGILLWGGTKQGAQVPSGFNQGARVWTLDPQPNLSLGCLESSIIQRHLHGLVDGTSAFVYQSA